MKTKFLVITDETPESQIAMRFACREAMKTQSGLVLMVVIEPEGFQHWLGVESLMKEEAQAAAEGMLKTLAADALKLSGIQPELVIREGNKKEQLLAYLSEAQDFVILVLGAAMGTEGPGPLVSGLFADKNERLSVPVT
ncbi:MAG: universal stress protein, partial [Hyphomicrobiales bacterium]|nr:universal stress protein [Hyphomicrobiales bacterium]